MEKSILFCYVQEATLISIQFTCVYLATKIVDRMPMMEMLRYILTHLYGSLVSKSQAYDVESKCLEVWERVMLKQVQTYP